MVDLSAKSSPTLKRDLPPLEGDHCSDDLISIVIPTFNGGSRISNLLDALLTQAPRRNIEILVVDDGSTDDTAAVVRRYLEVRLITQANAGPAAARNLGATKSRGNIILFTDDDCVPEPDWLDAMLAPFQDREVVGVKGAYRTHQKKLVARFVQLEYEDRYRLMASHASIDFIDTYSAAFRRDRFLEMGGYDPSFPVACAEDVELSYRMSAKNWKMKFAPNAIVYHTHPDSLWKYVRKKYKFAFWRVLAVRKNPGKALADSHTPQLMKVQLLFAPVLILGIFLDLVTRPVFPLSLLVITAFVMSALPFARRAMAKDVAVGLLSPLFLCARAVAQVCGVSAGLIYARRKPAAAQTEPAA